MESQPELSILLFRTVARTRREIARLMAAEEWATAHQLRPGCGGVLRAVAAAEGLSQREIADRLALAPSDVVDLVDRLEAAGLLRRERSRQDRRRYGLWLTPEGRTALTRFRVVAAQAEDVVLAPLTASERGLLARLLTRVVMH